MGHPCLCQQTGHPGRENIKLGKVEEGEVYRDLAHSRTTFLLHAAKEEPTGRDSGNQGEGLEKQKSFPWLKRIWLEIISTNLTTGSPWALSGCTHKC